MLSFEEKKAIFDTYSELTPHEISLGRMNYQFQDSAVAKTVVVKNLHPNGNALIYAGYLPKEDTKAGYISIHDATENEIRTLTTQAIQFLRKTEDGYEAGYEENWQDDHSEKLILRYENRMWAIYMTSGNMEAIFSTKEAAESYLTDEGFYLN